MLNRYHSFVLGVVIAALPVTVTAFEWSEDVALLNAPSEAAAAVSPVWARAVVGDRAIATNTVWWQCRQALQSYGQELSEVTFEACYDGVILASPEISSFDEFDSLEPGTAITLPLTQVQVNSATTQDIVFVTQPELEEVLQAMAADLRVAEESSTSRANTLREEVRSLYNGLRDQMQSELATQSEQQKVLTGEVDSLLTDLDVLSQSVLDLASTQGIQGDALEAVQSDLGNVSTQVSDTATQVDTLSDQVGDIADKVDGVSALEGRLVELESADMSPSGLGIFWWLLLFGLILGCLALIAWLYRKYGRLSRTVIGHGQRLVEVEQFVALQVKLISETELSCSGLEEKLSSIEPGGKISLEIEDRRQGAVVPHVNVTCKNDGEGAPYLELVGLKGSAGKLIKRRKIAGEYRFTVVQVFKLLLPAIKSGEPIGIARNATEARSEPAAA